MATEIAALTFTADTAANYNDKDVPDATTVTLTNVVLGNTNYSIAATKTVPATITKAQPTITFVPIANRTYNNAVVTSYGTANVYIPVTDGSANVGADFDIRYTLELDGSAATEMKNAGTYTVTVSAELGAEAKDNYEDVEPVEEEIIIGKADPSLLVVTKDPTKMAYKTGEIFSADGAEFKVVFNDGTDYEYEVVVTGATPDEVENTEYPGFDFGADLEAGNYGGVLFEYEVEDDINVAGDLVYGFTTGDLVVSDKTPANVAFTTDLPATTAATLSNANDEVTLTIATGTPTPAGATVTYQWYKKGDTSDETLAGETGTSLVIDLNDIENGDKFYCVATVTPADGDLDDYVATSVNSAVTTIDLTVLAKSTITAPEADYGVYSYTVGGGSAIDEGTDTDDVEEGTEVVITAEGALSVKVVKTGEETTEVTVTDNKFTMPAYGVTIMVEFEAPPAVITSTIIANATGANGDYTYTVGDSDTAIDDGTTTTDVEEGTEVTITAVPEEGYKAIVKVTEATSAEGQEAVEIEVTVNEDGTFTFVMPDCDVVIEVTFEEIVLSDITSDIGNNGTLIYTIGDVDYPDADGLDATDVEQGTAVTVTATADTGYNATVKVTKSDDARVEVPVINGQFIMPEYDVTITATFTKKNTGGFIGGGGGGGGRPAEFIVTYNPTGSGTIAAGDKATEKVNSGNRPKNVPTVTAKENYKFLGWTQDGKNVIDPTTVTIRKNTTFTALYEWTGDPEDMPQSSLIDTKYLKPYAIGYVDGSFRPQNNITRGELAAMIARLIYGDELPDGVYDATFSDVEDDTWYNKYIGYLEDKNVLNGYEDGTFRPLDPIARDEIAAVITRAQSFIMVSYNGEFTDVTDEDWAKDYIATLASLNILTGYEDGSFGPHLPLARSEAVTIINRVLDPSVPVVTFMPNDISGHWAEDAIILAVNERKLVADAEASVETEAEAEAEAEADAETDVEADAEAETAEDAENTEEAAE